MSFLGVRSFRENEIFNKNKKLLSDKIPIQYHDDFLKYIDMKKLHEREITLDEINIYLSQHPSLQYETKNSVRYNNNNQEFQQESINRTKNRGKLLYSDNTSEKSIKNDIEENMKKLAGHESGTSWMKWGTILSGNSADQITAAGFKALIEQNKILIRQNELIRRQNETIIELLSNKDE